ncbi:hypothetical protein RB213_013883 [Colletotrichum asianum]
MHKILSRSTRLCHCGLCAIVSFPFDLEPRVLARVFFATYLCAVIVSSTLSFLRLSWAQLFVASMAAAVPDILPNPDVDHWGIGVLFEEDGSDCRRRGSRSPGRSSISLETKEAVVASPRQIISIPSVTGAIARVSS